MEELDIAKSFAVSIPAGLVALLWTVVQGYKSSLVDDKLPGPLKWSTWPRWAKSLFVFALSFLGAVATAMTGGLPWVTALTSAVGVALAAMGSSDLLRSDTGPAYKARNDISIVVKPDAIRRETPEAQ